ncbi:hypothetical protein B2J88_15835 [Rhodococcus sp. SRB_17]|nr:hypothetical protein [Rhodococcus sp. SRB_17]OYD69576.1 hypothetical protein BDB13_3146 [Rhodococcus sp. OK302]
MARIVPTMRAIGKECQQDSTATDGYEIGHRNVNDDENDAGRIEETELALILDSRVFYTVLAAFIALSLLVGLSPWRIG